MIYVGIDFSVVSPALTIYKDGEYKYISFTAKKGKRHKELEEFIDVIEYLHQTVKDDYVLSEQIKIIEAINLANLICDTLDEQLQILGADSAKNSLKIGLEGFSFNSISNSTLDLCLYQSILRSELSRRYNVQNLFIFSPSSIKKNFTGKGNATKVDMIEEFKKQISEDDVLYNYIKDFQIPKTIQALKPIDDIVDSYAVIQMLILHDAKLF